jgi:transposase InsO family protein
MPTAAARAGHQQRLRLLAGDLEVRLSTGRTGQCWDNALAGSFFASLKGECLDLQPWPTRAGARRATVDYIAWYNGTRLHSALGYQTPTSTSPSPARRSPLRQPDRATGPVRQTGATPLRTRSIRHTPP